MLASGTRLGPYEVVAPLGAGGMGEVYRARDTRLDRTVAIKILPPALASSPQLKQRFEREARLISQMSHPHICTIHDVGAEDGVEFLVMEYLEGETLAERLEKGPLPLDKVIRHAIEIADALDKAHRQGIVHRDLKPANVMLTRSGAKLLDFGLAKTASAAVDGDALTLQKSLTAEGTIVGTFQYMAPEQLEGLPADPRTDIFAFGALLYEMITGKRAFDGKTRTSVIAAIVERDPPPVSELQPLTPPALARLVKHCLAKDPDERWQTAHDLLLELRAVAEVDSTAGAPRLVVERRRRREMLAWSLAGAFMIAAAAAAFLYWRATSTPLPVYRASIIPPDDVQFALGGDHTAALTISPDGRYITFVGTRGGGSQLWVRRLDESTPRALAGTENARYPFWSPDSSQIGFFAGHELKRVSPSGGAVVTVSDDANDPRGASWGSTNKIIYAPHWRSPLFSIDASGGKPAQITQLDASRRETTHRYPHFLPDGDHFLFLAGSHIAEATSGENAIYVGSLSGAKPRLVVHARSNVAYADGYIFFYRDRQLIAQRFDLKELAVKGEPRVVVDRVRYERGFFRAVFDVAPNGPLVYQHGPSQTDSELVWFDRDGKRLGTIGEPAEYYDVRIAPNGKDAAIAVDDPADLWIVDAERGLRTRFTSSPFNELTPVFSPDGASIAYSSDRSGLFDTLRLSIGSRSNVTPLLADEAIDESATDWTNGYIVYDRRDPRTTSNFDIWALPLDGRKPFAIIETAAVDAGGRVSPDGRWLAYTSLESGRPEVYVTSFPQRGRIWQISHNGGGAPAWRRDGKELFYTNDKKMLAVPVTTGATFEAGTPVELFEVSIKSLPPPLYDVAPDGNRFLVNVLLEDARSEPITVVTNWHSDLNRN